jgi:hypothetical protein
MRAEGSRPAGRRSARSRSRRKRSAQSCQKSRHTSRVSSTSMHEADRPEQHRDPSGWPLTRSSNKPQRHRRPDLEHRSARMQPPAEQHHQSERRQERKGRDHRQQRDQRSEHHRDRGQPRARGAPRCGQAGYGPGLIRPWPGLALGVGLGDGVGLGSGSGRKVRCTSAKSSESGLADGSATPESREVVITRATGMFGGNTPPVPEVTKVSPALNSPLATSPSGYRAARRRGRPRSRACRRWYGAPARCSRRR